MHPFVRPFQISVLVLSRTVWLRLELRLGSLLLAIFVASNAVASYGVLLPRKLQEAD